jgi:leader peptidase (prepilin peptidase) / N-methyltransferase
MTLIGFLAGFTVFLFGAVWGSFFYTLALRMCDDAYRGRPRDVLAARSHCPHCHASVSVMGLVPFAGFAYLRGRCARCGGRISWAYPAAEAGYGLLALLSYWLLDTSAVTLSVYLLLGLAAAIAIIDAKTFTIPGSLSAAFFLVSLFPVISSGDLVSHALGALGMSAFFAVIMLIFPGSFGGGDVKLAAAIGFFAGWEQSIVVLEAALMLGSVAGVIYATVSGKGLRIRFPFAPPLAAGLAVAVFWGEAIMRAYLEFFS